MGIRRLVQTQFNEPRRIQFERGCSEFGHEIHSQDSVRNQSWVGEPDYAVFIRKSTDRPYRIITEFRYFGMAVAIQSLGSKGTNSSA
jgi:hypothetical protein